MRAVPLHKDFRDILIQRPTIPNETTGPWDLKSTGMPGEKGSASSPSTTRPRHRSAPLENM